MLEFENRKEDPRTTAKRLEEVREWLRIHFLQPIRLEDLESTILEYLHSLGHQLSKKVLARRLAHDFLQHRPVTSGLKEERSQAQEGMKRLHAFGLPVSYTACIQPNSFER